MGVDIGPKTVAAYAGIIAGAKTISLERPDGHLREFEGVRQGDGRRRPGRRRVGRDLYRRRRRFGRRCEEGRRPGQDQPHLDRRRRLPRIYRLRDPARHHGPGEKMIGTPRVPFVAGNWKMNLARAESRELARKVVDAGPAGPLERHRPHPPVHGARRCRRGPGRVGRRARGPGPLLGGPGGFYGRGVGAHAQGRRLRLRPGRPFRAAAVFGETDATVGRKVRAALKAGLRPIVCVGEVLEEREAGRTAAGIRRSARPGPRRLLPGDRRIRAASSSPTSPSGPSGPEKRPPPARPRRSTPISADALKKAMEKRPPPVL